MVEKILIGATDRSPLQFSTHRMFQKTSDVFLGKAGAICSRCISSNKGIPDIGCLADIRCLTKMNSVWGNEIGFGIIISRRGQIIISPIVPACSTLYPVFCRGERPLAPTIIPDIGCFKNIRCLLPERVLFVPEAFHRTRDFQTSDVWQTSDV